MGPNGRTKLLSTLDPSLSFKINLDAETTLDIFFGDVEFFKALPLIETLMDLSYAVQDVIGQFEEFILSRKGGTHLKAP